MSAVRDIGDFSTDPDGGGGQAWTTKARDSLVSLWALNGGLLATVAGTNSLTASVGVSSGFTAYGDGLVLGLIPANTNTGGVTLNVAGVGAKAIVDPDGDALVAGSLVAGTLYTLVFVLADDHFRLVTSTGVSNVTVQGGIHLHRSLPTRLVSKVNETTGTTQIASRSHQAGYTDSRVVVEGSISRKTAAGSDDDDGFTVALFVDGAETQTLTDAEIGGAGQATSFAFEYEPGDTSAHTYSIRVTSTLGAAYFAGGTFMVLSEFSPNG